MLRRICNPTQYYHSLNTNIQENNFINARKAQNTKKMNLEATLLNQSMVKNDLDLVQISLKMERDFSKFLTSQSILLKAERSKPFRNMFCIKHYKKNIKEWKVNLEIQKKHTQTFRGYLECSEEKLKNSTTTL